MSLSAVTVPPVTGRKAKAEQYLLAGINTNTKLLQSGSANEHFRVFKLHKTVLTPHTQAQLFSPQVVASRDCYQRLLRHSGHVFVIASGGGLGVDAVNEVVVGKLGPGGEATVLGRIEPGKKHNVVGNPEAGDVDVVDLGPGAGWRAAYCLRQEVFVVTGGVAMKIGTGGGGEGEGEGKGEAVDAFDESAATTPCSDGSTNDD